MARLAAAISAAMLSIVAAFQCALVLGAPWGSWTQGGAAEGSLPASGRMFAAVSAVILVAFVLGLLGRAGRGPLRMRRRASTVIAWIAVAYGIVAVVLNAATPSGVERAVWLPYSVVLLAAEVITVLATRGGGAPPRSN